MLGRAQVSMLKGDISEESGECNRLGKEKRAQKLMPVTMFAAILGWMFLVGSFLRWDDGPASEAGVSFGGAEGHCGDSVPETVRVSLGAMRRLILGVFQPGAFALVAFTSCIVCDYFVYMEAESRCEPDTLLYAALHPVLFEGPTVQGPLRVVCFTEVYRRTTEGRRRRAGSKIGPRRPSLSQPSI